MTISLESIKVGKCYLVTTERGHRVRWVVRVMPDGRIQFERRIKPAWMLILSEGRAFAAQAEREVACDWTPDTGEA